MPLLISQQRLLKSNLSSNENIADKVPKNLFQNKWEVPNLKIILTFNWTLHSFLYSVLFSHSLNPTIVWFKKHDYSAFIKGKKAKSKTAEVEKSIDKKNKTIKIQDRENLMQPLCFGMKCSRKKKYLWSFSQRHLSPSWLKIFLPL